MMKPAPGRVLLFAALLALSGCGASPPPRYHALRSAPAPTDGGTAAMLIEVLPVAVPQRLDRDALVLGGGGADPLEVREGDRWAAPLADEMRQLVADALWQRLHAADIYRAPVSPGSSPLPHYRVALRVEHFDVFPGRRAVVEGSWTARRLPQGTPVACRIGFAMPVLDRSSDAAVAALADGASRLATALAKSLERLDHGDSNPCGGEDGAT